MAQVRVVCLLTLFIVGCQSGRVSRAQASADGDVIAFSDSRYETIYVANALGVRRLRESGEFLLSPNGRWLLILRPQKGSLLEFAYRTGDELVLLDIESDERYVTRLRCNIPDSLVRIPEDRDPHEIDPVKDREALRRAERVRIFFQVGPEVFIGPIWGEYWRWRPEESLNEKWARLATEQALEVLPSLSDSRLLPEPYAGPDHIGCLVEIPSDGLVALRTIWVRPDGSTIELLRKNDAPLKVLTACVVTLISPLAAFNNYNTGSMLKQFIAVSQMPLFWALTSWHDAFQDLGVDRGALEEARTELGRKIEHRRANRTAADQ